VLPADETEKAIEFAGNSDFEPQKIFVPAVNLGNLYGNSSALSMLAV
jgi:hypothetical protein